MHSNSLPKHVQLSEMLIREIAAGRLTDGARLPTERQMASELNVAVGTLRKALGMLETQGLLERIQGSGNYVRYKPDVSSIYAFFRLELLAGGGLPAAEILDIRKTETPASAPFAGVGRQSHRFRRLRFLDDYPAALEDIWLDDAVATEISGAVGDSLYLYYKNALNLVISKVEDKVGVDVMPGWTPSTFGLAIGEPCGYIERVGWDQNGTPVEFSKTWFNPAMACYASRLS